MKRAKTISLAILALLVIVVVLQNTETVRPKLLFWSVAMPRAVLLLVTLLAGFALGMLARLRLSREKPAPTPAPAPEE